MQLMLDLVLIALLGATLFQAVRLERALGVLKRDRASLEQLVSGFNDSTRQAEQGVERLRSAAEGAGRQIGRQIDTATALKDDLTFLSERGEKLADRLDAKVRSVRDIAPDPPREIFAAALMARGPDIEADHEPDSGHGAALSPAPSAPRLRSQAERDLFKALRLAR